MRQFVFSLLLVSPLIISAQQVFTLSSSYGFSKIKSKTFESFVSSYNEYNSSTINPDHQLEKFSGAKTFDIALKARWFRLGYTNTSASTSVGFLNGEGRSFDFTHRCVSLGVDFSTDQSDPEENLWLGFGANFLTGWQDITTAYEYKPGMNYFGGQQKQMNGQYYQGTLQFQTELSMGYKFKFFSIFAKGGILFPNFLNADLHNLERSQQYFNLSYLPTDYGAYFADPSAYEMDAIDNKGMFVSCRNWIYTFSVGVAVHFLDMEKIKKD